jgi:LPXTG-motif cell wall-anchored protein
MDSTVVIVVIGLFALIVIAAFLVFRRRGKVKIKGPFGMGLDVDVSNEPEPAPPAVEVSDARSREGGLLAEDRTGRGATVERVDTKDDILVSSESSEGESGPKAETPE